MKWNGATREPPGDGLDGYVRDLAEWHGDLVAVGQFDWSGDTKLSSIARWDGDAWPPIGEGTEFMYDFGVALPLGAVTAQDNGLFIAGAFVDLVVGDATLSGVAWWNGTSFEPLDVGTNDLVEDVVITPDGRAAFVGGPFTRAGGQPALGLGRWEFDDLIGTAIPSQP